MGESLEAHLEDAEIGGTPGGDIEGFKVAELIRELNQALNESSFFAKSRITRRNVRGILRGNALQDYLMDKYGFRIRVLDTLIANKLQLVLSIDGKGRKEIEDVIGKGVIKVEAKSGFDFADRLFGGNMPR